MEHKVFCVFDQKAEAYLKPFFTPTEAMAVREFANAVNDPDHFFSKNAADFQLFEIGSYEDTTAELVPNGHKSLGNGLEFKEQK